MPFVIISLDDSPLDRSMDLALATNGLYDSSVSWLGKDRFDDIRSNGAVMVGNELIMMEFIRFIDANGLDQIFPMRMGKECLTVVFNNFYMRKGEPWKERFDLLLQ